MAAPHNYIKRFWANSFRDFVAGGGLLFFFGPYVLKRPMGLRGGDNKIDENPRFGTFWTTKERKTFLVADRKNLRFGCF